MMAHEIVDQGITRWSKIGGIFLAGWLCSDAFHQTAISDRATQMLSAVTTAYKCEHFRGDKAVGLAQDTTIVAPSQLPKDCPHPPSVPLDEHPGAK